MKWIDHFQSSLQKDGKSINTINSYSSDIEEFLIWFYNTYGKEFDGQILEQDIREFKNYLLNIRKLKPSSINRKLATLRSFNTYLINIGIGKDIDIISIAIADFLDRNIKILEKNELNKFKRAVYTSEETKEI